MRLEPGNPDREYAEVVFQALFDISFIVEQVAAAIGCPSIDGDEFRGGSGHERWKPKISVSLGGVTGYTVIRRYLKTAVLTLPVNYMTNSAHWRCNCIRVPGCRPGAGPNDCPRT